jgi:hypothetical protein
MINGNPHDRRHRVDLKPYSVGIGRGDGLVARSGDVVMYVADETTAAPLLAALDTAVGAQSPGKALAKALAAVVLGPDSALIPPFGVLAPAAGGLLLILRGPVAADIEAEGGDRKLSGDRALTWVEETLCEPVDKIMIGGRGGVALTALPHTDLRAGVVPGGGFIVRKADAPSARPQPAAAKSITPEQRGAPTKLDNRAEPVERQGRAEPVKRQRPAQPAPRPAPRAGRVGASPRKPGAETAMPRRVVGALAANDEAVYPLDRPYVIGRNPLIDKAVRDSIASPIFLPDDPQISRVHAYVTVHASAVLVRDAGTPAGTFIAAPGDATWIRVGDRPTELKPGWCLRIGQRILAYQKPSSAQ